MLYLQHQKRDIYICDFEPTMEEIKYINLGLEEIPQTSYEISKDLYNVRVEANGKSHIYKYGSVRYDGDEVDEGSSWNVGVKFQNNEEHTIEQYIEQMQNGR